MSEDDIMGQQDFDQLPVGSTAVTAPTFTVGNGNLSFQASENTTGGLNQTGISSIMQSSPPPHSYRHSRAYRHFKNPPQPHMCIRTTTNAGEELFINVLSWTRIVIPQEPSDPIPLYGGMRVPPGSPRSPPIVFAVMANPEVLKDSGRHSKDPEERRAMIELMCDFVEAMNPGVKLVRNAIILKDRDISGELKDVWNAVQVQRDREREEQLLQQRQQQHFHNTTAQQMFPKTTAQMQDETSSSPSSEAEQQQQQQLQEETSSSPSPSSKASTSSDNKIINTECNNSSGSNNESMGAIKANSINASNRSRFETIECVDASTIASATYPENGDDNRNRNRNKDSADKLGTVEKVNSVTEIKQSNSNSKQSSEEISVKVTPVKTASSTPVAVNSIKDQITSIKQSPITAVIAPTPTPPVVTAPPKKEKLGGFLPNGCIFPRFKNSKHKDKDKDKEKDSKSSTKDKEKTILNALKKGRDKKIEQQQQKQQIDDTTSQYEKNCINLENEVEKLDLNKIDSSTSNDNVFIKLKVAAASVGK